MWAYVIDLDASLTNFHFNFSDILASRILGFVATGVLASSGNGHKAQGSAFKNFQLQIRVSAEVRKFSDGIYTPELSVIHKQGKYMHKYLHQNIYSIHFEPIISYLWLLTAPLSRMMTYLCKGAIFSEPPRKHHIA